MINHRKPWTLEEETAFAEFMIAQFSIGIRTREALVKASDKFGRSCRDRWFRYGLIDLYKDKIKEARKIARATV